MAFFLRRLRNHAEAEDMTQEVFVRLATADRGAMQSAEAYIFRVAANMLSDRGRREKVRADYRAAIWAEDPIGVDPLDPARVADAREDVAAVVGALKTLPERTRAIFILYRLENMDKRAIAEALGISISAIDKHFDARSGSFGPRREGRAMRPDAFDLSQHGPVEQASAWCLRLSEGSLTHVEQAEFDAWLGENDLHRQAFDDTIRTWRAVEQAGSTPELVGMRTAALIAFRRGQRARWTDQIVRSRSGLIAVAATIVLLIVGAGTWVGIGYSPQAYQTGIGERRVVVLSDGSQISLDSASKVDVRYLTGRRELRLDYGRAKFTVAKNPNRPFTVAAADKVVLATGTQFSVELLQNQVHVILYEGHVQVLDKASGRAAFQHVALTTKAAPADQVLTPGRELVVAVSAPAAEVLVADPVRSLSWEGGQLVFVDEPLSAAVEQVNRYSDDKVSVGDPAAGNVLVSGVFTRRYASLHRRCDRRVPGPTSR